MAKIRNHIKYTYIFFPANDQSADYDVKKFTKKSALMRYLNKLGPAAVNGFVRMDYRCFGQSGSIREWFVWYNDYSNSKTIKIELRQQYFRGRKFINKPRTSKEDKKYFAFSDKVVALMCAISSNGLTLDRAERLRNLFIKRGFKDFTLDADDSMYVEGHIGDGIDYLYWSDRCNSLRMKAVLEDMKRKVGLMY